MNFAFSLIAALIVAGLITRYFFRRSQNQQITVFKALELLGIFGFAFGCSYVAIMILVNLVFPTATLPV
jgi:hypothetical protein